VGIKQEEPQQESSWVEAKTQRSVTSYHHRKKKTQLGKINLLPVKMEI